jgi:hypothetical protein
MSKIIVEGVTLSDLSLSASGSGPGCATSTINPGLTETKISKSNVAGKSILSQLEAKIICPGTGGAVQSNCTASKVNSKKIQKGKLDSDVPLCVSDILSGGICSGDYQSGNTRVSCTCNFTITITASQQQKLTGV